MKQWCSEELLERNASPSFMINEFGFETLAEKRAESKAILMYKVQNDLIEFPQNIFHPSITHPSLIIIVAKQYLIFQHVELTAESILLRQPQ